MPTDRSILIHDITLREGEQAAGVAFDAADRIAIARALDEVGVQRIQVGFAGQHDDAVREMKGAGIRSSLSELCVVFDSGWKERVDLAARAEVDVLLMLMRASDAQLAKLPLTREQALDRVSAAVAFARERVGTVVFQPSFATTADPTYLEELCVAAAAAGAHEVSLADTVGIASPGRMGELVASIKRRAGIAVGVHAHDDFGLAVANTLAAIEAGADVAEVSVLGLGERAGNCPLEELVVALEQLYAIPTAIDLKGLTTLAETVAKRANVPIPFSKPIVGEDVFTQKLDMHVRVAAESPWLHEPFDPGLVGQQRRLKLGRGSGKISVRAKLDQLGVACDDARLMDLVTFVNRQSLAQKGVVTDEQLLSALAAAGTDSHRAG